MSDEIRTEEEALDPADAAGEVAAKAIMDAIHLLAASSRALLGSDERTSYSTAISWAIRAAVAAMPEGDGAHLAAIEAMGNGAGEYLGDAFCCTTHLMAEVSHLGNHTFRVALTVAALEPSNMEPAGEGSPCASIKH